jgi:hypothetical protein
MERVEFEGDPPDPMVLGETAHPLPIHMWGADD